MSEDVLFGRPPVTKKDSSVWKKKEMILTSVVCKTVFIVKLSLFTRRPRPCYGENSVPLQLLEVRLSTRVSFLETCRLPAVPSNKLRPHSALFHQYSKRFFVPVMSRDCVCLPDQSMNLGVCARASCFASNGGSVQIPDAMS